MDTIDIGEKKQVETLINGKTATIKFNRPCRYVIETTIGTVIEGLITPNNPLIITPQGDIKKFEIFVDKESMRGPTKIEKDS